MKLQSMLLLIMVATTSFISSISIAAYTPTDHFLVDCGSSESITSDDKRQWEGDEIGKYFSPGNAPNASRSSIASFRSQVPYRTARVFTAPFTYIFPLSSSGPKFLRLFFNPSNYSDDLLDIKNSYFSLLGNNYTLLNNFSAYLSRSGGDTPFFYKEFYINIPDSSSLHSLNLTFNPNHNSYAFVNGIEIVSVPDALYRNEQVFYKDGNYFTQVVTNKTAMEVVYRLNVGGNDVSPNDDTGMFRSWGQDISYLTGTAGLTPQLDLNISYTDATPPYTAPVKVYTSTRTMGREPKDNLKFNLTWVFQVHAGFTYLMRLHFCEISLDVVQENYRVFSIYINGQLTWESMDVFREAGGRLIPIYRDFAVLIPDKDRKRRLVNLSLELHPYIRDKPVFYDALLNGLEIFKVNDSDGSLAGANPDDFNRDRDRDLLLPPKKEGHKKEWASVEVIVGCVIGGVLLGFLLLCFLIFWRRRQRRAKDGYDTSIKTSKSSWVAFTFTSNQSTKNRSSSKSPSVPLPSHTCRRFTFDEIRTATANFDSNFIIGAGGFGNVYRGYIDQGTIAVAIKRLNPSSKQGAHEFQTEIEMLSKLRHLHLVSLIGYSDENGEMVLVYEYMSQGTLRDHLYVAKITPLSWIKRLEVCIGAARGLQYLHTGARYTIIHRDVKSTNILLDDNWLAKVSDFGLSKIGPTDSDKTHVSTAVKGSLGYLDPEYFRRQQLTEKSDVYSFGVVLLEVLSGRPPVVTGLPKDQTSLAEWCLRLHKKKTLERIVDPNLIGQIAPECLTKFVDLAIGCLQEEGSNRPSMGDVVWALEFALQLQLSTLKVVNGGLDTNVMSTTNSDDTITDADDDSHMFTQSTDPFSSQETRPLRKMVEYGMEEDDDSRMRSTGSGSVFSQITNPLGR
ncbi:unnamed protein product [Rhodiola kirilowii]